MAIAGKTKAGEAEQHHGPGRRLRNHGARKRERRVERPLVGDVGADTQPVGLNASIAIVARPALQVPNERPGAATDRSRRRQPKEVAIVQLDLGHKEIMISRESEGGGERYVELDFLPRDRTIATGEYAGKGVDAPRCTELRALKLAFSRVVENLRPLLASRSSNATSEGELTRVGTFGVEKSGAPLVRPTFESLGNTR